MIITVDLKNIPAQYHEIVKAWYWWHDIGMHRNLIDYRVKPGVVYGTAAFTDEENFKAWGDYPPEFTEDNELLLFLYGDPSYYLFLDDQGFYVLDKKARGNRKTIVRFARIEEANKYILSEVISSAAIPDIIRPISKGWYEEGLDPRVSVEPVDPDGPWGLMVMMLKDNPKAQVFLAGKIGVTVFSHAMALSFGELNALLHKDIPNEWSTRRFEFIT